MGIIVYQSKKGLNVTPCEEVLICLKPEWAERTVSGSTVVTGRVQHGARCLGSGSPLSTLMFHNPRGAAVIQFTFEVDKTQFEDGFFPSCADIVNVQEKTCALPCDCPDPEVDPEIDPDPDPENPEV